MLLPDWGGARLIRPEKSAVRSLSQGFGYVVLWAYLVSPIVIYLILKPRALGDALWLFNGVTTVLWVATLHVLPFRPLTVHLTLLPLYLATAVDLFLLGVFGNRLSSAYFAIILTEAREAPELLSAYLGPIVLSVFVLAVVLAVGLRSIRHAHAPRRFRAMLIFVILLLGAYGALFMRNMLTSQTSWQHNLIDVAGKEMSSPVGAVFQFGVTQYLFARYADMLKQRTAHRFEARQTLPVGNDELVLWVVGESSRPMNWQLFGYQRPTNPLLRNTDGIVRLPHLRTTAASTSVAVPSMLSLRSIDHWDAIMSERSVVSAFNEAGFETWWLSAQEVDGWGGPIPHIAAEASRRRYFDRVYDEEMLPALRQIVSSPGKSGKTFIIVHTKGSHFDFKRRYPPEFTRFDSGNTDRRSVLVDAYDNSILYTDWFLAQVIEILQDSKRKAVLLYASDHGENLLDDERQLFGHALSTEFDLGTVGLLWFSQEYASLRADHLKALQQNADKPISLGDLPHAMLHLSGIEARGLDLTRSLFNPDYQQRPQLFRHRTGEYMTEPIKY